MRLVYKASDVLAQSDTRPPRWPNRPEAFALSAAPRGSDREWNDVMAREATQILRPRAVASQTWR